MTPKIQTMYGVFLLSLVTLLSACAASQPQTEANRTTTVEELKNTLKQRDERFARFNEATPEQRQVCEVSADDCRMLVSEKRNVFIQNHGTAVCRNPEPDIEARCITDELLKRGNVTMAVDYYKADLWCLDRLLECLIARQDQAKTDSVSAKAVARRNDIEQSETGIAERARASLAEEKIKYVRATLPPDAEGDCDEAKTKEDCLEAARSKEPAFALEFDKSEQEYQRPKAAKLHDEMTAAEAACYQPELDCLMVRLPKYGETAETRTVLEKNFRVLEQRQRLVVKLGPAAAQPCLEQTTNTYQPEIIRCYLAYVREPVLFFRRQLHRAFLTLHQAQVDCLKQ